MPKIAFAALMFCVLCFAQEIEEIEKIEQEIAHDDIAKTNGTLSVQSSVPAGIWVNGVAFGNTPFSTHFPAGWLTYSVRSPGYWSEVFIVEIKPGEAISQEVKMKAFKMPAWGIHDVSQETNIRVLESLYDSLVVSQPVATPDSVCVGSFVREYPLPLLAPEPLNQSSIEFRNYYSIYDSERTHSFYEYYAGCTSPAHKSLDAVWGRINELGLEQQLSGHVPVLGAKFEPTTPDGLNGDLVLLFRSKDLRADVAWRGKWEHPFLPGDDLVRALTASTPMAMSFVTVQNQTVWIPVEGGYSRHYYNYHELNVSWNGFLIPLKGEFVLPDYLLAQQQVIDWLASARPAEGQPSAMILEMPLDLLLESHTEAVKLETPPIIKYADIAKIPGGKLKRNGNEMEINPFGINTTPIRQNVYKEKCGAKKNFGKFKGDSIPAHSVTWSEANSCCISMGGELPTEAEWEYAARAGLPFDYIWDEKSIAKDYAVFEEKKPAIVASKKPNDWGLYDMFGNVQEWVKDDGWWFGKYKYLKGGSWKTKDKDEFRFENHAEEDARYWGTHVGFRCVFRDNY